MEVGLEGGEWKMIDNDEGGGGGGGRSHSFASNRHRASPRDLSFCLHHVSTEEQVHLFVAPIGRKLEGSWSQN